MRFLNKIMYSILIFAIPTALLAGQKYNVKIIDRQDSSNSYSYVVPGYSTSSTTGSANCTAYSNSANCSGTSNTNGVSTPGFVGSYQVRGATFALELPDGRVAVVNCEGKVNWNPTNLGWYRSCRTPLVTSILADFDGDNAKLTWPVSIDGKKTLSETYKIKGILDKQ